MPLDPVRVEEVRGWLTKAATDLRAADHDRTASPPLLEDVVFHAQQAVEKALKAFLSWHDRPFRKTHDLGELGQACLEIDATLSDLVRDAAPLTEYAWKFRYPGEPDQPSADEATAAIASARAVNDAIVVRLPTDVRP